MVAKGYPEPWNRLHIKKSSYNSQRPYDAWNLFPQLLRHHARTAVEIWSCTFGNCDIQAEAITNTHGQKHLVRTNSIDRNRQHVLPKVTPFPAKKRKAKPCFYL
jgi:hypothetical protein